MSDALTDSAKQTKRALEQFRKNNEAQQYQKTTASDGTERYNLAQQPQREQPVPGELVYSGTPWKIYRQDAGMGEHDYIVLLNDVYFCRTDYSQTAHEIIRAVNRSHPPAPEQSKMLLRRSCFGDFEDCPCDDECVVSEYCAKYHEDHQKNSCGMTDSQCGFVQEHEKAEAARKATLAAYKELQSWRYQQMRGTLKKDVWKIWNEETEYIDKLRQSAGSSMEG
jgi:hypothetical protein